MENMAQEMCRTLGGDLVEADSDRFGQDESVVE